MHLGAWDWALVAAVTLQASVLAYQRSPFWKAFVLLIPIPCSIAVLAVNCRVDSTNLWGMVLLYLFTHAVRLLHYDLRMPIVPAIALSALGYCGLGAVAVAMLPESDWFFWASAAGVAALAGVAWATFPRREEEGGRTDLPPWIKLPAIAAVVLMLVLIKNSLRGFTTVFPMVGVIAAYEARNCLWTISRAIPAALLTLLPMAVTIRLAQDHVGLPAALALAWVVVLCILWPLTKAFLA